MSIIFSFLVILFATSSITIAAETIYTSSEIDRGAYLAKGVMACGHCHSSELSGNEISIGDGGFILHVPNITQDKETGIGAWSDEEIETALRKGIRPDSSQLSPIMPFRFYNDLTSSDMHSIIAYLRQIKPVNKVVPKNPIRAVPPAVFNNPVPPIGVIDKNDKLGYGSYLVAIGHCMRCHTPTKDGIHDYKAQLGAGGELLIINGVAAISKNLTNNPEDGIGNYSVSDIKAGLKSGHRPDGTSLAPIMGFSYYNTITDDDLEAIAIYLKSLPSKPNPNPE